MKKRKKRMKIKERKVKRRKKKETTDTIITSLGVKVIKGYLFLFIMSDKTSQ